MNKLKYSLLLVTILLSISLLSATVVINSPAASGTISGSTDVNVTVTGLGDNSAKLVNLTFYVKSSSTANSSWSQIATNNSLNMSLYANETITAINLTNIVEDANNYILNVTAINETDGSSFGEDTNTGITVDYTTPTTPSSLTPTSDSDGSFTFTGTVTGSETTACTLTFDGQNPGAATYSMTHSGDTCTYAATSVPEQTYNWYIVASDGTNTTNSATQTTNVDIQSGGGYVPTNVRDVGVTVGDSEIPIGVVIFAIIAIVVVIAYRKKK